MADAPVGIVPKGDIVTRLWLCSKLALSVANVIVVDTGSSPGRYARCSYAALRVAPFHKGGAPGITLAEAAGVQVHLYRTAIVVVGEFAHSELRGVRVLDAARGYISLYSTCRNSAKKKQYIKTVKAIFCHDWRF